VMHHAGRLNTRILVPYHHTFSFELTSQTRLETASKTPSTMARGLPSYQVYLSRKKVNIQMEFP
jgi:hypothetical protein